MYEWVKLFFLELIRRMFASCRSPCNNGVCVCPAQYTGTFCGFGNLISRYLKN